MTNTTAVGEFFQQYQRAHSRRWPMPDSLKTRQSLMPPVLADSDLDEFERRNGGNRLPSLYREFLTTFGFVELELPWIMFPSADRAGLDVLEAARAQTPSCLLPFAMDPDQVAFFCFDFGPTVGQADSGQISLYVSQLEDRIEKRMEEDVVIPRVFSSFSCLLGVMRLVLESPVVPWVRPGTSPSREQRALLQTLKNADPEGFGGASWDRWWKWNAIGYDT